MPPEPWYYPRHYRGWLAESEAKALADLTVGKTVVEFGAFAGKSTIAMAQHAALVVSVDWHGGDAGTGPAETLAELLANLDAERVRDRVALVVGRFEQVSALLAPAAFDVAFVDGHHTVADVERDSRAALRCVRPGGVLAWHDVHMPAVYDGIRAAGFDPDALQRENSVGWITLPE